MDCKIAGINLQHAALADQLSRVRPADSFARLLLLGKLKAIQRELRALPSEPFEFKGGIYQRDGYGKVVRLAAASEST